MSLSSADRIRIVTAPTKLKKKVESEWRMFKGMKNTMLMEPLGERTSKVEIDSEAVIKIKN